MVVYLRAKEEGSHAASDLELHVSYGYAAARDAAAREQELRHCVWSRAAKSLVTGFYFECRMELSTVHGAGALEQQ